MPNINHGTAIASRQIYYRSIDLKLDGFNCGDDQASDWDLFAHVFGGVGFIAFNRMINAQLNRPGSAGSLAALSAATVRTLKEANFHHQGVHSSQSAEGGNIIDRNRHDGSIGCGYLEMRRPISQGIFDNGEVYIAQARQLMPELFRHSSHATYAQKVVSAHGWFAGATNRIGSGREAFLAAMSSGAEAMMVRGGHKASEGIINLRSNTTFDTNAAVVGGQPAYNVDLWASNELFAHMPEGLDERQTAIASLIDIIGTMKALGVKTIAVRR